ncbi:hypothetical protein [Mesorhizobium sp. P5_C1]
MAGKNFELLFEKQFSLLLIAAMQANVACNRKSQITAHGATTTSSAFSCDSQLSGNGEAEKRRCVVEDVRQFSGVRS